MASIYILSPSASVAQFSTESRNDQRSKIDTSIDDQLIADSSTVNESELPALASANQKYSNLIQVLNCPNDRSNYGDFDDWGYWGGGSWCEQTGKAGYWVWVAPNWYIWQKQN
ncbi:hypothetical protein [Pleurocapsa sp. PCC 7319]|uniref:hypothetical protein n=1 Tax=Pleurocapsa sp. PCC 7319 TaxID=118161 RepID=UPI0003492507|nr:hypothetical protein [Pleurocapsa sp. PCC 7319]